MGAVKKPSVRLQTFFGWGHRGVTNEMLLVVISVGLSVELNKELEIMEFYYYYSSLDAYTVDTFAKKGQK